MHDYVIVGAGTAGCVLADRLSASGRNQVLLLEAGPKPDSLSVRVPAGMPKLFRTRFDWAFESEPNAAVGGRRVFTPRGKMLGGCSNMNAQIHQWCHPADFDGWQSLGARGWSWNDVAPALRRIENFVGGDPDDTRRGRSGAMHVATLATPNPLTSAFVQSANAVGISGGPDYNGGPYAGAWVSQVACRNGRRFSAYDAHLKPAMSRRNLQVLPDAHVVRVLFEDGQASGVAIRRDGREQVLRAGRGVVLAAGTYGTPHLLQLSGVGPATLLREHGIAVVREQAQVGENLQDHPLLPVVFRSRRPLTLKSAESPGSLLQWLLLGRGMLASNVAEAVAFTSTRGAAAPDVEICFVPAEWRNQGLEPAQVHAFTGGVVLLTPRSRGHVRLKTREPSAAPAIDLALLSDPEGADLDVLVDGVELFRRIAAAAPLGDESAGELAPGPEIRGRDGILTYCREALQTIYHPVGTCRMGDDDAAPVTPDLRLRGIGKLWVADASVMPTVPRGHPNAVVAMIAARAAEWIDR
jgi:choline dehydrogenase